MGVVYYANYLVWMELGRAEYCRAMGARYRDMEEQDGILLAVADAHCRYLAPARYDDESTVRTDIGLASRRMVEFRYAMRNERGEAVALGETKHVFLSREFRPVALPEKYFGFFGIVKRALT